MQLAARSPVSVLPVAPPATELVRVADSVSTDDGTNSANNRCFDSSARAVTTASAATHVIPVTQPRFGWRILFMDVPFLPSVR